MLHINLHIIEVYIYFIKFNLNLKEFHEYNQYFKSYQVNKIDYFVEFYFNLNLHLNLTEFRQPLQVQSHLEMPGILVQLGHIQRT